jgi:hypothetical protein
MKNKNNKKENNEINNTHNHEDTCDTCVLEQHHSYYDFVDELNGICLEKIDNEILWFDDVISVLDRVKTNLIQYQSEIQIDCIINDKLKEQKVKEDERFLTDEEYKKLMEDEAKKDREWIDKDSLVKEGIKASA